MKNSFLESKIDRFDCHKFSYGKVFDSKWNLTKL